MKYSEINCATSSSLYLAVSILEHPVFHLNGNDIHVEVPVPLTDAILGGEASVPTPKGKSLALKIPPETQNSKASVSPDKACRRLVRMQKETSSPR
jgi:DnaJ-class molecular chaperone